MKNLIKIIFGKVIPLVTAICLLSAMSACGDGNKTETNESEVSSMASSTNNNSSSVSSTETVDSRFEIADFYKPELEDTRNKLKEVQTEDSFSFLFITDTHIDYTGGKMPERYAVQREMAALVELANTTDIDCIIFGGDLIHGTSSYDSSMKDLQYFVDMLSAAGVPTYAVHGNHDTNMYHGNPCPVGYGIDQEDWTTKLVDPLSRNTAFHDPTDPYSTYYYVDFPEKKTRLITIDPYNNPFTSSDGVNYDYYTETWNHVDQKQLDWLAGTALSADNDGWQYILLSHAPINTSETFGQSSDVDKIISAFNNGLTYTLSDGTVVDYSDCTSYMPICYSGHTHINAFKYNDQSKFIDINTGSGKVSYYPQNVDYYANKFVADWVNHPYRDFDSITEATFDAVNISPSGTVNRFAFGASEDNIFDISSYKK